MTSRVRTLASALVLWTAGAAELWAVPAPGHPLRVTVTLPPQAWLVEQIAGDRVQVRALVGPGDSPATFSPSDAQITEVTRSALFYRIGTASENGPWFHALERLDGLRIVDLREGVALREIEACHVEGVLPADDHPEHNHPADDHHHHIIPDPHIWLSPARLQVMAGTIARTLTEIDPAGSAVYASNLEELLAGLRALEEEIHNLLSPCEKRTFFVLHPAWGYFAEDFGLSQVAIERGGKEPSESELTDLVRQARAQGTRVIFVQPQFQGQSARVLAKVVRAAVETLDPLAVDLAENLRHAAGRLRAAL